MLSARYAIQWVGRCQFKSDTARSDKVWGWFLYVNPTEPSARSRYAYVFWGATGKALNFKRHDNNTYSMKKLVRSKIDRKYQEITTAELESLWSDLYETMHNKFIFHLLVNDV
jgi:hypothetical protein